MILTATPEPLNTPPRIRLDFDAEGDEFLELSVLRDGRPIRQQPAVAGLDETHTYDYEAPLGQPVTYTARGTTTAGAWTTVHTETWASLSGWSTVSGSPAVAAGRMSGGFVRRSDFSLGTGAFRMTFADEAAMGADTSLFIGDDGPYVHAYAGTLTLGEGYITRAFVGESGQPIVLDISADRRTAKLSQGSASQSLALVAATTSEVGVWPYVGSVGAFTLQAPNTPDPFDESISTQLDVASPYLIHPSQPPLSVALESNGIVVEASADEQRTYASRQAVYQPDGRREAVAFPLGPRGAGSWTLVLLTEHLDDRNRVLSLLDDQAPILLRSPAAMDWDLPDGWYSVGDVQVQRPVNIGGVPRRRIILPLTRVAEPPVKIAPSLTWGDLLLRGYTWGDLLSHTWLDLLMGEL